jgi:hypothetical protein
MMKKIIVLGVHNSGTTLLSRIMHLLRVNFGLAHTKGNYGYSFEFPKIGIAMQHSIRFGEPIDWGLVEECKEQLSLHVEEFFQDWEPIDSAIKHPFLCAGLTAVDDDLLKGFTFINCNRPLENSIKGAMQAYPKRAAQMTEYQTDLHAGKEKILARAKSLNCTIYNWNYDQMATKARSMVERLYQFLETPTKPEYIEKALSLYDAQQHHLGGLSR